MIKGSKYFLGIHDFKNFSVSKRNESKSTIREIYNININKIEKMVYITVEGSAFLSHQVRRMCGALVSVGTEVIKPNIIKDMLENRILDVIPQTLPADGLCLIGVNYKYFNLDGDQNEK